MEGNALGKHCEVNTRHKLSLGTEAGKTHFANTARISLELTLEMPVDHVHDVSLGVWKPINFQNSFKTVPTMRYCIFIFHLKSTHTTVKTQWLNSLWQIYIFWILSTHFVNYRRQLGSKLISHFQKPLFMINDIT